MGILFNWFVSKNKFILSNIHGCTYCQETVCTRILSLGQKQGRKTKRSKPV